MPPGPAGYDGGSPPIPPGLTNSRSAMVSAPPWARSQRLCQLGVDVHAISERNAELEASRREKSDLVERLRRAVDELSNPILEVLVQRLLAEVARRLRSSSWISPAWTSSTPRPRII